MATGENRLGLETSPYLRQHRFDPVDWYPWGKEALERARGLDRPLFLSIGYSSCHWCHVMAHESFSDPATAAQMNESVVAVKIDREEHPDVDALYMESVVTATGQGGWPMSVFCTPDGRPFFAGTYFPSVPRPGMPTFRQVLAAVAEVWQDRRAEVEAQADALAKAVAERLGPPSGGLGPGGAGGLSPAGLRAAFEAATRRLCEMADMENGGFGSAPKFPQPLLLDLLVRAESAGIGRGLSPSPGEVLEKTLSAMASGGLYDQVGGGFSRYSVDAFFLVPHFEKMLYDQALLARVYLHAWQLTGDGRWRQVLDETLSYVLTKLRAPSGGLFSAEDADSEGEEGRFYLWSPAELEEVLGPELAAAAAEWYGVSEEGNFEGRSILHRPVVGDIIRPAEIERARGLLQERRESRVRPGLDDKVITEWNALACAVLAEAAAATGEARYARAATEVGDLLVAARAGSGGRTPRVVGAGRPIDGVAGDCAALAGALVRLFELTGERRYLSLASEVADELVAGFVEGDGTVYTTRRDGEALIVRPTERQDGVIPSATSTAVLALARLGLLFGEERHARAAERIVEAHARELLEAPLALPELLLGAELVSGGSIEIAALGEGVRFLAPLRRRFLPNAVFCFLAEGESKAGLPLLEERSEEALYVCRAGACRLPARSEEEAERELAAVLGKGGGAAP